MIQRLSAADFVGRLMEVLENRTGIPCYSSPDDEPSPLLSVQLLRSHPENTKTMFIDVFDIWIHCISEAAIPYSDAPALELVKKVEGALMLPFNLPPPFTLQNIEYDGLETVKKDETGEGHAVLSFHFSVCYGFDVK